MHDGDGSAQWLIDVGSLVSTTVRAGSVVCMYIPCAGSCECVGGMSSLHSQRAHLGFGCCIMLVGFWDGCCWDGFEMVLPGIDLRVVGRACVSLCSGCGRRRMLSLFLGWDIIPSLPTYTVQRRRC